MATRVCKLNYADLTIFSFIFWLTRVSQIPLTDHLECPSELPVVWSMPKLFVSTFEV